MTGLLLIVGFAGLTVALRRLSRHLGSRTAVARQVGRVRADYGPARQAVYFCPGGGCVACGTLPPLTDPGWDALADDVRGDL